MGCFSSSPLHRVSVGVPIKDFLEFFFFFKLMWTSIGKQYVDIKTDKL